MNRRSFFASLAAMAGAASLSPTIFIPKFEPVHWKAPKPQRKGRYTLTCEYETWEGNHGTFTEQCDSWDPLSFALPSYCRWGIVTYRVNEEKSASHALHWNDSPGMGVVNLPMLRDS